MNTITALGEGLRQEVLFKGQFTSEGYSGATDDYFECLRAVSTNHNDATGRDVDI